MKLAYLTTQYPKVSHSFIRREILELERRGHEVLRMAIRASGEALVDPSDVAESARTFVCLGQPSHRLLLGALGRLFRKPASWLRALGTSWRMSRVSDRGPLRHGAYFVEACRLASELEAARVSHVHVHFGTNAAAVARLIGILASGRITFSLTVHGPDEFDAPIALSLREKVDDAVFVVAISAYGRAQLQRWCPPDRWPKIHIVGCAVDEAFLGASEPVPAASSTLVSVGRLSAQKGQHLLIEAFAKVLAEHPEAQLVICGDGELRESLETSIDERGIAASVVITGWLDEAEIRRRILSSRALVLPSFAEGLPVVLMEALALGRPVVSTFVAGIPELVEPSGANRSGWLVPAGDVDALAEAMRAALAESAPALSSMGRAGAAEVSRTHRLKTEVDKLERLLEASVAAHGS